MNTTLEQHRLALKEQQDENVMLKDMLAQRGISYRHELENRKTANSAKTRNTSFGSASTMPQHGMYNSAASKTSPSVGYSPQPGLPERPYAPSGITNGSGHSGAGSTHYTYSPADPGISEQYISIKRESSGVSDMPGVFEKDPQLQVDFILACVLEPGLSGEES